MIAMIYVYMCHILQLYIQNYEVRLQSWKTYIVKVFEPVSHGYKQQLSTDSYTGSINGDWNLENYE